MMNKLRRLPITYEQKKAVLIYPDLEWHLHGVINSFVKKGDLIKR